MSEFGVATKHVKIRAVGKFKAEYGMFVCRVNV